LHVTEADQPAQPESPAATLPETNPDTAPDTGIDTAIDTAERITALPSSGNSLRPLSSVIRS